MVRAMESARDIIEAIGGVRVVATKLDETWKTVHNWTRPGRRIPARYWPNVARIARRIGRKDISLDVLQKHQANEAVAEAEAA